MRLLASLASGLLLAGCVSRPPAPTEVDRTVERLTGAWSNAAQHDAAPEALKRPPAPGHPYDWIDRQSAEFFRVAAPEIGQTVFYLEWRGADGAISRQRLWAFRSDDGGRLTGMDFYTFREPAPFAGRGDEPGAFMSVGLDDLIAYPDGCTLQPVYPAWDGIVLEVDEDACAITARSGRRMGIRARIELGPNRIAYSEAGVLEGGAYAFLVPGGLAYDFRRSD